MADGSQAHQLRQKLAYILWRRFKVGLATLAGARVTIKEVAYTVAAAPVENSQKS